MNHLRHYEVVLLIHPEYSDQISTMQQRYQEIIQLHGGHIHRQEDWGRRPLAYPIQKKIHKAHYLLYNIEISLEGLAALETAFQYNDAVLRSLVIRQSQAITEPSVVLKQREERSREVRGSSAEQSSANYRNVSSLA